MHGDYAIQKTLEDGRKYYLVEFEISSRRIDQQWSHDIGKSDQFDDYDLAFHVSKCLSNNESVKVEVINLNQ